MAGGPFYSGGGNSITAQEVIKHPSLIVPLALHTFANECALVGQIDALHHLKNHRVYLYSGTEDSVVDQGVGMKLRETYDLASVKNVHSVFDHKSEHGMPTKKQGINCDVHASPYILKCNYSASGDILTTIYGKNSITPPDDEDNFVKGNLIRFNQKEFFTPIVGKFEGMADDAFIYVPTNCQDKSEKCRFHIHFHGCKQSVTFLSDQYAMHNGMNAWAERNNIIVLYPQTKATNVPVNPYGCFDWFGIYDPLYYSKYGLQMSVIAKMVKRVTGHDLESGFFNPHESS